MRLSEAVRLGATYRPQTTGRPFQETFEYDDGQPKLVIKSCALGAAYEAAHRTYLGREILPVQMIAYDSLMEDLEEWFSNLLQWIPPSMALEIEPELLPDEVECRATLRTSIIYMNDDLKWTREEIADLLDRYGY